MADSSHSPPDPPPPVWDKPAESGALSGDSGLVSAAGDRTERLNPDDLDRDARPASPCPVARWVGHFEILGELGRGGMGVVYHAWQHGLNRAVALKMVLAGAHANPDGLQRFLREAEAVAHLHHPNIVQVYEVGRHDDCPYFTMEYVEGGSLSKRNGGKPQPPLAAAQLVETLARAVQHAHEQGIIHRDLKPANILLQMRNAECGMRNEEKPDHLHSAFRIPHSAIPKITDFGLAKRLDAFDSNTRTGDVVGTPSYMAPEQARGDRFTVGPAADIYGLGTILYECLTGRAPFVGPTEVDTVRQVLEDEPIPPSRLQPGVPRDLATICMKCLRKDPRRRYAAALDLAEDLRRFQNHEPIKARPADALERAWRWCRRRPAVAGLLAALLFVIVGAFVAETRLWLVAAWQRDEATYAHRREEALRAGAEMARQEAETARTAAESQLYFSRIALADRELSAGNVAGAEALLAQCQQMPETLRGWEWRYLTRQCRARLDSRAGHRHWVNAVAFGQGGLVSAGGNPFTYKEGQLFFWPQQSDRDRREETFPDGLTALACSPDGRLLAAVSASGGVSLWRLPQGEPHKPALNLLEGEPIQAAAFSPDGRTLALGGAGVGLWDLTTGDRRLALPDYHPRVHGLAFDPDGGRLATVDDEGHLRLWDAATGRPLRSAANVKARGVAFSPDGRFLAAAGDSVRVWDAESLWLRLDVHRHNGEAYGVAFSPDGLHLASVGADRLVRVREVRGGREVLTLRGHRAAPRCVAFSPDGAVLASGDQEGAVLLWDLTTDPRALLLPREPNTGGGEWVGGMAFAADGPTLRLADQGLGRLVAFGPAGLPLPGAMLDLAQEYASPRASCAFSRDGRLLVAPSARNAQVVKVWDAGTHEEVATLPEGVMDVRAVAFSDDGRRLAVGRGRVRPPPNTQTRGEVVVWDLKEDARTGLIPDGVGAVRSLALSPEGRRLATVGVVAADDERGLTSELRLWDVATGREMLPAAVPLKWGLGLSFSPDGRRLAVADFDEQAVRVLKADPADDGLGTEAFAPRKCPAPPTATAFSPDGRRLAAITYAGTVQLFAAATGQDVLTLSGLADHRPDDYAYSARVVFSPDGRWLASSNWDGSVNLFDGGEPVMGPDPSCWDDHRRRVPYWRLRQARAALRSQERFAFDHHARHLQGLTTTDAGLLAERGRLRAATGEWDLASADLAKAWALAPRDARLGFETACVRLRRDDRTGFRAACEQLRERLGRTTAAGEADLLVRAWVMLGDGVEGSELLRWDETASRPELTLRARKSIPRPLQRNGVVLYRVGRYAEAARVLEQALQDDNDHVATRLMLAMAQHRLGQAEAAKRSLETAVARLERGEKELSKGAFGAQPLGLDWTGWLTCQLWRAEAEALIQSDRKLRPD